MPTLYFFFCLKLMQTQKGLSWYIKAGPFKNFHGHDDCSCKKELISPKKLSDFLARSKYPFILI